MYSYSEVRNKIENSRRFGNLPGVEVSKKMLEKLENPQQNMEFVHVAGTNGKGSVCAFMSSILKESGMKVGVFTSPHLVDFEERITVNGEYIPKEEVKRLGNMLLNMEFGVNPTMFDYCLCMAVMYFVENKCDIVILETGLGGRLDSTNCVGIPKVSVITKIGYDHMAILGNDIKDIAKEKAGIIKKGTNLVIERQQNEVLEVIHKKAGEEGIDNIEIVKDEDIEKVSKLPLKNKGVHQWENASAAALGAKIILKEKGMDDGDIMAFIKTGLCSASWPGRMELISNNPFLMIDGAHNSNGVLALKESLCSLYPNEKFHFIMGVMADKDYEEMVDILIPLAESFTTVTVESERALNALKLKDYINEQGVMVNEALNLKDALDNLSVKNKNILFGSLYFVGEVKEFYK